MRFVFIIEAHRLAYGGWGRFEDLERAIAKLELYEEDF